MPVARDVLETDDFTEHFILIITYYLWYLHFQMHHAMNFATFATYLVVYYVYKIQTTMWLSRFK